MEEIETRHSSAVFRTDGGDAGSRDRRFAELRRAALSRRLNGKGAEGGGLGGLPAERLRFCLPLIGRFYLVRLGPSAKAPKSPQAVERGARTRIMLLAGNVVIGFIAAVVAALYALHGDAPFVFAARETGFFLLRQLSVLRELIGGILSLSVF